MKVISENSAKKMLEVADDPAELIINLNKIREREFDGKNAEKKDNEATKLSDEKINLNVEDETTKRIKTRWERHRRNK